MDHPDNPPRFTSPQVSQPQTSMPQTSVPHRRGRKLLWWLLLLGLVVGGWYWFAHRDSSGTDANADKQSHGGYGGGRGGPGGGQTPTVAVATVGRANVPVYLDALGTIQAFNTVTVHAQVDGQLLRVLFNEGQDVKAGDLLAQIDPRVYQAAYDQAAANVKRDQATAANAKQDLARYAGLGNAIAQQTVDTQRATLKQAEATAAASAAAAASAKTQLDYTQVTAPIDGRTGIRQVDIGNIVHPADTNGIVVITQLQPISVVFSLPQQALPQLATAQANGQVTVEAVDSDNKVLDTGTLVLVDNQVDQATGTVKLKATLPNPGHKLWPGAFANVRLLANTLQNALYVPAAAVQRGPNATYVFLYNPADQTVKMRGVTVAQSEDQVAVISEGLKDGDQVVTDNAGKLNDGMKVAVAAPVASDRADAGGTTDKPVKENDSGAAQPTPAAGVTATPTAQP